MDMLRWLGHPPRHQRVPAAGVAEGVEIAILPWQVTTLAPAVLACAACATIFIACRPIWTAAAAALVPLALGAVMARWSSAYLARFLAQWAAAVEKSVQLKYGQAAPVPEGLDHLCRTILPVWSRHIGMARS